MKPPQLRCILFPSMYLRHLLVLPATFGLQCLLPPYPYFRALYAVPVRQVRGLLTSSFRFRLTEDTLAFGYILPTTGRIPDLHRLETCAARRTKKPSGFDVRTAFKRNVIDQILLSKELLNSSKHTIPAFFDNTLNKRNLFSSPPDMFSNGLLI